MTEQVYQDYEQGIVYLEYPTSKQIAAMMFVGLVEVLSFVIAVLLAGAQSREAVIVFFAFVVLVGIFEAVYDGMDGKYFKKRADNVRVYLLFHYFTFRGLDTPQFIKELDRMVNPDQKRKRRGKIKNYKKWTEQSPIACVITLIISVIIKTIAQLTEDTTIILPDIMKADIASPDADVSFVILFILAVIAGFLLFVVKVQSFDKRRCLYKLLHDDLTFIQPYLGKDEELDAVCEKMAYKDVYTELTSVTIKHEKDPSRELPDIQ